tara:strand:+ start:6081 stop:6437 length:357 start_codon:yes stop_codon:yes gene_type:complete
VFNALPQKGCIYEPKRFYVNIPTSYVPDILLPNGIYVEIKGFLRVKDRIKYVKFKEQFPEIDLRFVFYNSKSSYQGAVKRKDDTKPTLAEWAERYGFIYADKRVPSRWFGEYQREKPN